MPASVVTMTVEYEYTVSLIKQLAWAIDQHACALKNQQTAVMSSTCMDNFCAFQAASKSGVTQIDAYYTYKMPKDAALKRVKYYNYT